MGYFTSMTRIAVFVNWHTKMRSVFEASSSSLVCAFMNQAVRTIP
jgi:hypothetical protein